MKRVCTLFLFVLCLDNYGTPLRCYDCLSSSPCADDRTERVCGSTNLTKAEKYVIKHSRMNYLATKSFKCVEGKEVGRSSSMKMYLRACVPDVDDMCFGLMSYVACRECQDELCNSQYDRYDDSIVAMTGPSSSSESESESSRTTSKPSQTPDGRLEYFHLQSSNSSATSSLRMKLSMLMGAISLSIGYGSPNLHP